ncbi:hypothetical protein GUJ93_ZPchr0006g43673 [Zizania palustris]|uniref:Uncharacterized protein n=1 Tax=Zizania palustris TaxID=103762 RepID=A0A8J5VHT9_ZIZPA|nr:hypothetical protein GUJ93_ZPchr0006g43673 [Zizania palustris]
MAIGQQLPAATKMVKMANELRYRGRSDSFTTVATCLHLSLALAASTPEHSQLQPDHGGRMAGAPSWFLRKA